MANYLIGYDQNKPSTFFVVGAGLASISVVWEEKSTTDGSLGTPLAGGESMQSDNGGGGIVFNLGAGKNFNDKFDLCLEFPTIVTFSAPGKSSVIPTFIVTAGLRC